MSEIVIVEATQEHVDELGRTMRETDVAEVAAMTGSSPAEALQDGLDRSAECWTVLVEGDVLAVVGIYGVVDLGDGVGIGWLLTSPLVEQHAVAFMRACRPVLESLLHRWRVLYNLIDCRHKKAIRWAERLGFQLFEEEAYGVESLPFRPFIVRKEDLTCAHRG